MRICVPFIAEFSIEIKSQWGTQANPLPQLIRIKKQWKFLKGNFAHFIEREIEWTRKITETVVSNAFRPYDIQHLDNSSVTEAKTVVSIPKDQLVVFQGRVISKKIGKLWVSSP